MKKTCRYYESSKKCLVDGKKLVCKECGCYVKEDYIEKILKNMVGIRRSNL